MKTTGILMDLKISKTRKLLKTLKTQSDSPSFFFAALIRAVALAIAI